MGLSEQQFWSMSPRDLARRVDIWREQEERRVERQKQWWVTLYNIMGPMHHAGKDRFKPMTVEQLFGSGEPPDDFDERWRRAMERHAAMVARMQKKGEA